MCTRSSWGVGLLADAEAEGHLIGSDKFVELQQISASLQFQALFALLGKHPLRLEDGLDIFSSLDEEQAFAVSSHELLEECTNPRRQACQELHRQAADSPSLSMELLTDRTRVQSALERLNRNRDGNITLDEWKEFLAELLEKDLNFAIKKAWASGLVYFGHNCTEDLSPLIFPPTPVDLSPPPSPSLSSSPHQNTSPPDIQSKAKAQEPHGHRIMQASPLLTNGSNGRSDRDSPNPILDHDLEASTAITPAIPLIENVGTPLSRMREMEQEQHENVGISCGPTNLGGLTSATSPHLHTRIPHADAELSANVCRSEASIVQPPPASRTEVSGENKHDSHELSILLVFNEHFTTIMHHLEIFLVCWRQWRGGSGTRTVTACYSDAVSSVRKLWQGVRHRLENILYSSFLFNPAWRADFLYYEKNMNPVFGLLFCDPQHPLSFLERLDIEFCVYGWVFFTSALFALTKQNREKQLEEGEQLEEYRATNANKYIASFLLVTAPSMLLRVFLFYIFLCPCIVVRKKRKSLLTKYVFPLLEGVGHAVGVVTFLFSLCLYGFGVVMMMNLALYSREIFLLTYTANWLLTNFVTYIVWDFCIYFNPFLCCVPLPPAPVAKSHPVTGVVVHRRKRLRAGSVRAMLVSLLGMIRQCLLWLGLAQWQVERLRASEKMRIITCPDRTRAQRLRRVLSKPKLSVEVKKFQ